MGLDLHFEIAGIKESLRGAAKDGSIPWRYLLNFNKKVSSSNQVRRCAASLCWSYKEMIASVFNAHIDSTGSRGGSENPICR